MEFLDQVRGACEKAEAIVKEINELNLEKMSDKDLAEAWKKIWEAHRILNTVLYPFLPFDKALQMKAKEVFGDKLETIAIPSRPLRIEKFAIDAVKGVDKDELFRKYGYLFAYDFPEYPKARKTMEEKLADFETLKKMVESIGERERKFREEIKKMNEKQRKIAEIVREAVWLRTERTDVLREVYWAGARILEEVSRRKGVEFEKLVYYTPWEILDIILKGERVPEDVIEERKKLRLSGVIGGEYFIVSGKEAEELKKIVEGEFKDIKKFKGIVVSKGKEEIIEGEVRVVKSVEDLKDIDGKILVTSMTTPDYVTSMQKAIAILTDEGGLTCHAAIVSRELGKPCIVGSEIATKVLKDGTKIRMNMRTGEIEVL